MYNLRSRTVGARAFLALALTLNVAAVAEAQTEHKQILTKLAIQPPAWSQQLAASNRFVGGAPERGRAGQGDRAGLGESAQHDGGQLG